MNGTLLTINISKSPDLLRLVEEMKRTKQPRLLKQDSETVAMLMPMGTALEQSTEAIWTDYHPDKVHLALQQSAGTLTGVNRKKLLEDIAHARTQENHRYSV